MEYPIRVKALTEAVDFYPEVIKMNDQARVYIEGFRWCKEVRDSVLYLNLGSTLCIFLFEIENFASSEDNFLWIMVGDIPAMYLDVYGSKTTIEVLRRYNALAKDWISNVERGLSVDDCYPFNVEPTMEMADMLKKRVDFIEKTIIPNIDEVDLPPSMMVL
jgi:hypothetical protein